MGPQTQEEGAGRDESGRGAVGAHDYVTEAGAAVIHARRQPRNRSMDVGTYGAGQETAGASDTSGVFGFIAPHSMPMWPVCGACAGGPTALPAASFG